MAESLEDVNKRYGFTHVLTIAAANFLVEDLRLSEFYMYLLHMQSFALLNPNLLIEHIRNNPPEHQVPEREQQQVHFQFHERMFAEFCLCRMADNAMRYLVDLLKLIYTTRPETLRSAEQERVDFILSFSAMDDLIEGIAERRVEKAGFLGLMQLSDYWSKSLGFDLFDGQTNQDAVVRAIEIRNIIVHNRSVVSQTFVKRVPNYQVTVGNLIPLSLADVRAFNQAICYFVFNVDGRAMTKWDLSVATRTPLVT